MSIRLHRLAQQQVGEFLRLANAWLPGVVQGLYLVSSIALDDFHLGVSDVDFVAVAEPLDEATLDVLERIHRRLSADADWPSFDGVYVRWEHLRGPTELAQPAPYHLNGQFHRHEHAFEFNPAVWTLLRDRGVAVRGPAPPELQVWTDREALDSWTIENLNGYWAGLAEQARQVLLIDEKGIERLDARMPVWSVLGVARLHYTLTTGGITSKSGAGEYALARFPDRWSAIVRECLRIRRESAGYSAWLTTAQARDAAAFMAFVIDDANKLRIRS